MKLIIPCFLFCIYGIAISRLYKMGSLITCFEQNDESYIGYRDPIYNDPESDTCIENQTLCDWYQEEPYAGRGDVCDHQSPRTGITRNACYFNTIYGEEEDEEKTWSYKCWEISECPLTDEDGVGMSGCQVTNKRINCCCQEDYCNGGDLIALFAQWGRADHYPANFSEICDYDFGDTYVVFTVPGYENCTHYPDWMTTTEYEEEGESTTTEEGEEEESTTTEEGDYPEYEGEEEEEESTTTEEGDYPEIAPPAHAEFMHQLNENQYATSSEAVNIADIVLIFSYFILASICLGIGVFVGSKWKTSVLRQQQIIKAQQMDI